MSFDISCHLTFGVGLVVAALCVIIVLLTYCKKRYQPQLTLTQDGAIECSLVNCEVSISNSQQMQDENPFLQDETDKIILKDEDQANRQPKPAKPAAH